VDIHFNPIQYKGEPAKEIRNAWMQIKNCRFVGCWIPESLLLATKDCVFENCVFGQPESALDGRSQLISKVYLTDRKKLPETGPSRKVDILDAQNVPQPAGAKLVYKLDGTRLSFE
jgi:hypothetical protein